MLTAILESQGDACLRVFIPCGYLALAHRHEELWWVMGDHALRERRVCQVLVRVPEAHAVYVVVARQYAGEAH